METVSARYQVKDENNQAVLDGEGHPVWQDGSIQYDLGNSLEDAVEKYGADVVYSNFKASARINLQALIRTKLKSGVAPEFLQSFFDSYTLGVAAERTVVNPADAVKAAFATWSPEKQREYLRSLGVNVE